MKPGISAIVIAHNQVDLLKLCLKSIKNWVDQIIVIDLESTEDIEKVANLAGADYVAHKLVSIVESVRQDSLKYAEHEYVLFLDPDESIPAELAKDLSAKIKLREFDFFLTPRQNFVFGKWVKHSRWWPDFQTRVFRIGKVSWGKTLHAEAVASGNSFTYGASDQFAIHHENYRTLDEWISKNMRYAKADALSRVKSGDKLSLTEATKLSVSELISRFFAGEGYKDGMHGLMLSILQSFYYFMVYAYYWEAMKYESLESETTIKSFPRSWFSHGLSETLYWDKANNVFASIKSKLARRLIK
jgi:(heptosyl)LPS beta-1,4-glucosyltransferase